MIEDELRKELEKRGYKIFVPIPCLTAKGFIVKRDGWRVSKYKMVGDRFWTLKIRKLS